MSLLLSPTQIESLLGLPIYPTSVSAAGNAVFFLARGEEDKRLGILAAAGSAQADRFAGDRSEKGGLILALCPLTAANAQALRAAFAWLTPTTLGLRTSAGCGDRLGLATPGHIHAARAAPGIAMIFAQQSIRENTRTGRTPQDVVDDATWGVFQEGWREGYGADADHLKTTADADSTAAAGYTFFTVDPGDHVDDAAHTATFTELQMKVAGLPWAGPSPGSGQALDSSVADMKARYLGKPFDLEDLRLIFTEEDLFRAAAKYARAVLHAARMYRHLNGKITGRPWELEVSVDETNTPTSHLEHFYIASELKRLGVRWVSLAPRYVGRFEKGVDYIGNLLEFERSFAGHAAIARAFGPYKLSLHSGSDKFSIYGIAARHAAGLVHLKTAGASYLEALRATASFDPGLFREIMAFAIERYETDRASYHVSAELAKVPPLNTMSDADLPGLLDQFDARQVLHVTYGSVLNDARFKKRFFTGLAAHETEHYATLERHFIRHLQPLCEK